MRKITTLLTIAMFTLVLAPVAAIANGSISTGLTRDVGGGANPIIKAKWEMSGHYQSDPNLLGEDDSTDAGAQFFAPGHFEAYTDYSICAIVTDPDGVSDIDGVYTDIFYPSQIAYHPEDPNHLDQINGGTSGTPDYGMGGCGLQRGDENQLFQLSKTDGYNLFCDAIRNGNNNLPTFYDVNNVQYDYNEICDPDGELMKETAYVYCAEKQLWYEDPAGMYDVQVMALDKAGLFSNIAENQFEYLPLTSYEVDFTGVDYGNVKLNTHKRISGDLTFDPSTSDRPTVRNIGNTRLYMGVKQDDMGFGTTDGVYNVRYDARVGNQEPDWKNYWPEQHKWLQDILDLSETEEMDFSIVVTKFPFETTGYNGTMTLDAKWAEFRQCNAETFPS